MKALLFLIFIANTDPRLGYTDRELEDMRQTKERWHNLATQTIPSENLGEYIHQLGSALSGSATSKEKPDSERGKIYFAIRTRLLSIPGHAEYYGDRINSSRAEMETIRDSSNPTGRLGGAIVSMIDEQSWGFQTLENLPSVETVRVLGEFLSDDRGAELSKEFRDKTGQTPNSRPAVSAISKLGIANPPTPPVRHNGDVTDGMEAWRQWYSEVKSGRRTFRFIGDDTEYDLRGPSKRGAVTPGPRDGKRKAGAGAEAPSPDKAQAERSGYLPYLIGVVLLLAGYLFHRRQWRKPA